MWSAFERSSCQSELPFVVVETSASSRHWGDWGRRRGSETKATRDVSAGCPEWNETANHVAGLCSIRSPSRRWPDIENGSDVTKWALRITTFWQWSYWIEHELCSNWESWVTSCSYFDRLTSWCSKHVIPVPSRLRQTQEPTCSVLPILQSKTTCMQLVTLLSYQFL